MTTYFPFLVFLREKIMSPPKSKGFSNGFPVSQPPVFLGRKKQLSKHYKPRYRHLGKYWLLPIFWALLLTVCIGYMAASENTFAQKQRTKHTALAKRSTPTRRYSCVDGKLASAPASACGRVNVKQEIYSLWTATL